MRTLQEYVHDNYIVVCIIKSNDRKYTLRTFYCHEYDEKDLTAPIMTERCVRSFSLFPY
jgi:uncharacterized protein YhbP (UPF0306 family)